MFRKKVYGESRLPACPVCGRNAVAKNDQGVPVCEAHRSHKMDNLRCACGATLELRLGKWGPYGFCDSCGNISWSKVCELNAFSKEAKPVGGRTIDMTSDDVGAERFDQKPCQEKPREVKVTSDRPDLLPSNRKPQKNPKEITIRSDDPNFF
ncbi:MAG: hypothetical protein AABX47_04380 [Nanoarchaeota archaeon]